MYKALRSIKTENSVLIIGTHIRNLGIQAENFIKHYIYIQFY